MYCFWSTVVLDVGFKGSFWVYINMTRLEFVTSDDSCTVFGLPSSWMLVSRVRFGPGIRGDFVFLVCPAIFLCSVVCSVVFSLLL